MRDIPRVLATALRLLRRHWPALLTLALLGAAARSAAIWGAVHVSRDHGRLAQLILILAPVGFLLPVVAMLYVCRSSLPQLVGLSRLRALDMPSERRPERLVDIAASVLIPFLALYEGYGLLDQDIARFKNEAAFRETVQSLAFNPGHIDFAGRLGIYPVHVALIVVIVAWVARWGVGLAERALGLLALAYVGALADVYYTAQLAGQTLVLRTSGEEWLRGRRAFGWIGDAYHHVRDALGFLSAPLGAVVDFSQAVVGSWTEVILVPIAWLGVGAVVLARKEADEELEAGASATDAADAGDAGDVAAPVRPRGLPVRIVLSLLADVRKRVAALSNAVRLLASAGLMPMLAFSLVLLVVVRIAPLLSRVVRQLVGPVSFGTWEAYVPIENGVELAVSMAVTVPLVAAAVDWLVRARLTRQALERDLSERTGTVAAQDSGAGSET